MEISEQPTEQNVVAEDFEAREPEAIMKQEMTQVLNEDNIPKIAPELSDKLKNRDELMGEVKKLCDKLGKPYPPKLRRKRKTELSEILARLINEGINASYTAGQEKVKNDVEYKKECEKEEVITSSAVSALMNIQFLTYTIVERLSYANKHRLGNHYVKDVVKSIQENEEKKQELRVLLKNVYLLYREELEAYMHPLTLLALFNVRHCASCITSEDSRTEQYAEPKEVIVMDQSLTLNPVEQRIKQLRENV